MTTRLYTVRLFPVVASMGMYLASLHLPALLFRVFYLNSLTHHYYVRGIEARSGSSMLLLSVFGPFSLNFARVANPLLWVSWGLLAFGRVRPALLCLAAALLLTVQTFQLYLDDLSFDEAGVAKGALLHPLPGWYLWTGSIALLLVTTAISRSQRAHT